jgi:hypothetical protein
MASSREQVNSFLKPYDVKTTTIPDLIKEDTVFLRPLTDPEAGRFSYFPKIKHFVVFNMDHYIIYSYMNMFQITNCINKLNFKQMSREKKNLVSETCNNIEVLREINKSL